MAEKMFDICKVNSVDLTVQWVPREAIFYADYLSKLVDHDDWCTTTFLFSFLDRIWGTFTVDRFADSSNTKVKRFNSKYLCPNTEHVDAFTIPWQYDNNYIVPPICLIPKVLDHMRDCGAQGTVVVPYWPSAAFYPLIREGENSFKGFVRDWLCLSNSKGDLVCLGANRNCFIGSDQFRSDMLALRIQF